MQNAVREGWVNTAYYERLRQMMFQASRRELKKDEISMPTRSGDVSFDNTITGKLRMINKAKKEVLSHTKNLQELDAIKYIWNNPNALRYVGNSPLGQGKDKTNPDDRKNLKKKEKEGITGYSRYYFEYGGKTWLIKAARHGDIYETYYHIREAK